MTGDYCIKYNNTQLNRKLYYQMTPDLTHLSEIYTFQE